MNSWRFLALDGITNRCYVEGSRSLISPVNGGLPLDNAGD